jgi:hypothetical protein
MRGAMTPLIGRRTLIAVAADRLYVGHADNYEIASYDFMGKRIGLIRRAAALVRTSAKDVEYAMALALATVPTDQRAEAERELRTHVVPRTLPAYNALVADSEGLLWVQDYPRPDASSTSWSVFTAQGNEVARLSLPTHLEVYEIGRDYVLGRFLDPEESIPQVRIYRLQRPAATR